MKYIPCELNEIKSKHFLKNFHKFTNDGFRVAITWKTRNIQSFFLLKDKNDYKSCVIYKGDCSCGSRYIGQTKCNAEVRWHERNNPTRCSEPSKHLRNNIDHCYTWTMISNAPKGAKTSKNLEASLLLYGNLVLTNIRALKDRFYLEMVSYRPINDIMQTPYKEIHFSSFQFVALSLIALDN